MATQIDDVILAVRCFQARQVVTRVHDQDDNPMSVGNQLQQAINHVYYDIPLPARQEAIQRVFR